MRNIARKTKKKKKERKKRKKERKKNKKKYGENEKLILKSLMLQLNLIWKEAQKYQIERQMDCMWKGSIY